MSTEIILNHYLQEHIPITQALGCVVKYASPDKVIITAPFSNNINHKKTVFGGSLHAVATLACWGLLYTNFIESLGKVEIVISKSEVKYLHPVTGDFEAICIKPDIQSWGKFKHMLERKGKGRIHLQAHISENEKIALDYKADFVILKRP